MSDSVLTAIIGVAGIVIGTVGSILVASIQSKAKANNQVQHPSPVLGHLVDIRELRILRALYGEPNGRKLEGYRDRYYLPSLQAMIDKRWVRENRKRYFLTPEGAKACRAYL